MPSPATRQGGTGLIYVILLLLVLGGGAGWTPQGRADIRDFILANDLPAAVSFRRMGLFDGTSPNYVGDLGVGADAALVKSAKECDLFIAIGTRIGETVSQGYTLFDMAGGTPIIHVYPDQAEIGRVYRPALGITADLNAFAAAAKAAAPVAKPVWSGWRAKLAVLTRHRRSLSLCDIHRLLWPGWGFLRAAWAKVRNFRFTCGYPMRWPARRRSRH